MPDLAGSFKNGSYDGNYVYRPKHIYIGTQSLEQSYDTKSFSCFLWQLYLHACFIPNRLGQHLPTGYIKTYPYELFLVLKCCISGVQNPTYLSSLLCHRDTPPGLHISESEWPNSLPLRMKTDFKWIDLQQSCNRLYVVQAKPITYPYPKAYTWYAIKFVTMGLVLFGHSRYYISMMVALHSVVEIGFQQVSN